MQRVRYYCSTTGVSPSGKAVVFGTTMRRFESFHPNIVLDEKLLSLVKFFEKILPFSLFLNETADITMGGALQSVLKEGLHSAVRLSLDL